MNVIVSSAFVAIGALLCVVVLRRHPEHVVTLNANSVKKGLFRVHGFVFGLVRRLGRLAAHVWILARGRVIACAAFRQSPCPREFCGILGGSARIQEFGRSAKRRQAGTDRLPRVENAAKELLECISFG